MLHCVYAKNHLEINSLLFPEPLVQIHLVIVLLKFSLINISARKSLEGIWPFCWKPKRKVSAQTGRMDATLWLTKQHTKAFHKNNIH